MMMDGAAVLADGRHVEKFFLFVCFALGFNLSSVGFPYRPAVGLPYIREKKNE